MTAEREGVGRKGEEKEKSCFPSLPSLPAPSPNAIVFRLPQFPALPTICPWVSEDGHLAHLSFVTWHFLAEGTWTERQELFTDNR